MRLLYRWYMNIVLKLASRQAERERMAFLTAMNTSQFVAMQSLRQREERKMGVQFSVLLSVHVSLIFWSDFLYFHGIKAHKT